MKANITAVIFVTLLTVLVGSCVRRDVSVYEDNRLPLLRVSGEFVLTEEDDTFYIQGVNLGCWLNPEGYMFAMPGDGSGSGQFCNSPRLLNELVSQLVGPDESAVFWETFKDRYVTEDDIRFIASTGANTIRLPFHYALLTDDDYMGCNTREGFARMDSAVAWCERYGLYVVLDMHDCPGGQTGDNIDDSYAYPYLFTSGRMQTLFCSLWREIAEHYESENTVLGYELMNEPIATYFEREQDSLNALLEPLYSRCIDSIRSVDKRHIIVLGGAQWNGTFSVFTGEIKDDNLLYACHRYGHTPDEEGIKDFLQFRDSFHVAMCMTETGHRPHEWLRKEAQTLRRNHIGLLWWPYKKLGGSCWMHVGIPEGWDVVRQFAAADRRTFAGIRANRPDIALSRQVLNAFLDSILVENCHPDTAYINAFAELYQ